MYKCVIVLLLTALLVSCYKKDIQFGDNLAESHTRLITVDTVTPVMSTYVLDSFATSGTSTLVVGMYKDPFLGNTTAGTFFQFGLPGLSGDVTTVIPNNAVYDSLVLLMKPNGYYYGDTTKALSVSAVELAAQPNYSDASKLYNTSSVNLSTGTLGSFSKRISPARDTIRITLPFDKGKDFYDKIKSKALQMQDETTFLSYFKGICVQPSGSDNNALYTFNMSDSSVRMRIYYHVTLPEYQAKTIDFYLTRTEYQFNRIITDRTGTPLERTFAKQREFFATSQSPLAFSQSGTGSLMKIKFPSLRELLKLNEVVQLLDARLIVKPVGTTFDNYVYRLPDRLILAQTDATNAIGTPLADSTGSTYESRSPTIDWLYGENTAYNFNVTNYINMLLNTDGATENGLFVIQDDPTSGKQFNRGVFGSRQHPKFQTKLVLTIMTIQ